MDIRQIKYFLAVAEEGQITAAARRLNMAQPPLSYQIKALEEELGVKLFERGNKSLQLTEAGSILRMRGEEILELTKSTIEELKELNKGFQGTLNIGTVASSGAAILPQLITGFHSKYPRVSFRLWEGDTFRIVELLNGGIVEIGIIRTPFNSEAYECVFLQDELMKDPMAAVCNDSWSMGEGSVSISFKELRDKPLIIHHRYEEKITEACRTKGFEPAVLCRSDDIRSMISWAGSGLGIAIVPKSTVNLAETLKLKFWEIDEPSLETSVAVVWRKNRYLSSVARHFVENLKDFTLR
ncbi:MAG: LysR family transcriptional regulator [Bacillota bacterium]|nr:LysR family transcriptional regulator [Bacillota bacterium]